MFEMNKSSVAKLFTPSGKVFRNDVRVDVDLSHMSVKSNYNRNIAYTGLTDHRFRMITEIEYYHNERRDN